MQQTTQTLQPTQRLLPLKTSYVRAKYARDVNNRYTMVRKDFLHMVVLDIDTRVRHTKIIYEPKVDYYLYNKPTHYHQTEVPLKDCTKYTCLYRERDKSIATQLGLANEFFEASRAGYTSKRDFVMKNILKNPRVYQGDVNVEVFYRSKLMRMYGNHIFEAKLKRGFMDIETDTFREPDFNQNRAKVPINCISYLDEETKSTFTWVLRDSTIPGLSEIESNTEQFFTDYLYNDKELNKHNFSYNLFFCDSEEEIVQSYFDMVGELRPDFIMVWNINYDGLTIINRMVKKQLDVNDMMIRTYPELKDNYGYYKEDRKRYEQNTNKRGHYSKFFDNWITPTSYQYIDQMAMFSVNHARFMEPSYKLDYIGDKYGGVRKVDLRQFGVTISNVYHKKPALFIKYSIYDVFVQYCIEQDTNDLKKLMLNGVTTEIMSVPQVSMVVKNYMMESLWKSGLVIGNNVRYYVENLPKVQGALVSRPEMFVGKGIKIGNAFSRVFKHVFDIDATRMYPTLIGMNLSKDTTYGHIYQMVDGQGDIIKLPNYNEQETIMGFNSSLINIEQALFYLGEQFFQLPSQDDVLRNFHQHINEKKQRSDS